MQKHFVRIITCLCVSFIVIASCLGKTIVFFEKDFPSVENGTIARVSIERALSPLEPRFVNLADLKNPNLFAANDLLVLPYGSAFPADAWDAIQKYLDQGNLLVLGGRPFYVPVHRDSLGWRTGIPENTYARNIGIEHAYVVPHGSTSNLHWDEDAPSFSVAAFEPRQVFTLEGNGGRYRGLAFFIDAQGNRVSSPVVAEDFIGDAQPAHRRVYLSFNSDSAFWDSPASIELIRQAAVYASHGSIRLWLDITQLTIDPGDHVSGAIDVRRTGEPAQLTLELISGSSVIESRRITCGSSLHEEIGFLKPLKNPGLYKVRAILSINNEPVEQYTSGVYVRDRSLLHSGERLETGRDYFKLDGKPYLMVGTNYFSTDPYTSTFFFGSSIGGNPWVWEKDFSEMEHQGLTAVRTGIWLNRARYLDNVSGAANERLLRAIGAYVYGAAHHHLQVIFTFFAFDPQTEMQQGRGQEGNNLGPGLNPYLDPVAIDAQLAYIRTIVTRFRDVPFLSYDLINEPSFDNPNQHWRGNSPNGDPKELAAWQHWLENQYGNIEKLSLAWRVPSAELGSFDRVPLPNFSDLEFVRAGNPRIIRTVDYNLFAQDAFRWWVDTMIQAIRATGSRQVITVGQDEGGITDRVLNQFWGESQVNYTVNHTWWRDDALLWSSVAAKTLGKPNSDR